MAGTYSKVKTVVTGETITAADRNAEHDNHINNCDFAGLGDYSANTAQMQTVTDPYPAGVESLATDGKGELERIRYLIKQITGEAQWYIDPDTNLTAVFAPGTVTVFYQAAAPTGWTKQTTHNDKALRVVSGTGGGNGGSTGISSGITLAHTHTVSGHTHSISTAGAHDHGGATGANSATALAQPGASTIASDGHTHSISSAGGHDHGGATGSASPATDSQLTSITLSYIDVIVCAKD